MVEIIIVAAMVIVVAICALTFRDTTATQKPAKSKKAKKTAKPAPKKPAKPPKKTAPAPVKKVAPAAKKEPKTAPAPAPAEKAASAPVEKPAPAPAEEAPAPVEKPAPAPAEEAPAPVEKPAPAPAEEAPAPVPAAPVMGKYEPLEIYLRSRTEESVTLTFEQIETVLGCELPKSAKSYDAWWSNSTSHSQAKAWLKAGFYVINAKKTVPEGCMTFVRNL